MDLLRPTYLKIDLQKLTENFRFLQSLGPGDGFLCPMVKANAYGHGDLSVVKTLLAAGGQFVGVSSVEEGLHLRISEQAGEILVFGFHGLEACKEMIHNRLTPVVSNFDQLGSLCLATSEPLQIHLKFETGMHRLGFQLKEVAGVLEVLKKNPHLWVQGLGTHLFEGGNLAIAGESSHLQVQAFREMVRMFPKRPDFCHVYNSPAIASLYLNKSAFEFGFRPGLLVYGVEPEPGLKLRPLIGPVMEFKSKIVGIQQVKSGGVVSYGGVWQAPRDSTIGIVPAGYADGVCRSLTEQGEFLVAGQRVPVRGRVCMDYTMVDLTDLELPLERLTNQEVVIVGGQGDDEITIEEMAGKAGRIHYEVLTCISERVPRYYGAST